MLDELDSMPNDSRYRPKMASFSNCGTSTIPRSIDRKQLPAEQAMAPSFFQSHKKIFSNTSRNNIVMVKGDIQYC